MTDRIARQAAYRIERGLPEDYAWAWALNSVREIVTEELTVGISGENSTDPQTRLDAVHRRDAIRRFLRVTQR